MKRIIIICAFLSVLPVLSQEKLEIKGLGFTMDVPKGWIEMQNKDLLENLNKYDFTDEQLNELLQSNNSAVNLATYSKYDPKKYAGIIPTIKIRTHQTESKTIENFQKSIESSTMNAANALDDLRFTQKPVVVKISNKETLKFAVRFKLKNAGKEYEIISNSYYILQKGYFFSLNFIEESGKENNEKLFDDLVNSIEITK